MLMHAIAHGGGGGGEGRCTGTVRNRVCTAVSVLRLAFQSDALPTELSQLLTDVTGVM